MGRSDKGDAICPSHTSTHTHTIENGGGGGGHKKLYTKRTIL